MLRETMTENRASCSEAESATGKPQGMLVAVVVMKHAS